MKSLEQARRADELGFETVWAVEHHFLEEYSHSSAPELFLTAVAAQTSRIRVGHGAGVLPVGAVGTRRRDGWFAERASVYRTARVLMEGRVFAIAGAQEAAG